MEYKFEKIDWDNVKETLASPLAGGINAAMNFAERNVSDRLFMFLIVFLNICLHLSIFAFSFTGPIIVIGIIVLISELIKSELIVIIVILYLFIRWRLKEQMINRICRKYLSGKLEMERFKPLVAELEHRAKRHLTSEKM